MVRKKFLLSLFFPLIIAASSGCSQKIGGEPRRIYLYFTDYISPKAYDGFSITGTFFSQDNKSETCEAVFLEASNDFEFPISPCFWSCDVPGYAAFATFNLYYRGSLYSTVSMKKMNSVCFVWSASSFLETGINKETGFQNPSLSAKEFSAFILYGLDENSASYLNGCKAYEGINSTFYSALTLEEKERLNSIVWNDPTSGKTVTGNEKWAALKNASSKIAGARYSWLYWIGGTIILIISILPVIFFAIPNFRKKIVFLFWKRRAK